MHLFVYLFIILPLNIHFLLQQVATAVGESCAARLREVMDQFDKVNV
jgi:hypothetical protein